jgi:hypothetical protein
LLIKKDKSENVFAKIGRFVAVMEGSRLFNAAMLGDRASASAPQPVQPNSKAKGRPKKEAGKKAKAAPKAGLPWLTHLVVGAALLLLVHKPSPLVLHSGTISRLREILPVGWASLGFEGDTPVACGQASRRHLIAGGALAMFRPAHLPLAARPLCEASAARKAQHAGLSCETAGHKTTFCDDFLNARGLIGASPGC